jgi:hypothetical protein
MVWIKDENTLINLEKADYIKLVANEIYVNFSWGGRIMFFKDDERAAEAMKIIEVLLDRTNVEKE